MWWATATPGCATATSTCSRSDFHINETHLEVSGNYRVPNVSFRISRLTTTDGHLRDVPIEFADGLNCTIGARGTCKSTIVETIRFLFDVDRDRVDVLLDAPSSSGGPPHRGLIAATL